MIKFIQVKISILCLLMNICAFSQESKFALGAFGSLDYSYRFLKYDVENGSIRIRENLEVPKITYTIGANLSYSLNNKNQIYLALLLSDKGQRTENNGLIFGSANLSMPVRSGFNYHLYYLEIPLRYNVFFSEKPIKPFLTGGIGANILLQEKNIYKIIYADGEREKFEFTYDRYKPFNLQGQLGFGVNIEKYNLSILGLLKSSFLSANKNTTYKDYLYSVSIGVNYIFKRF